MAVKLERRIGIAAPDEVVWEVLSDIEAWPTWNAMYPRARGELRIGAPWELDLALRGQPPRTITPTVLDWVPYDHIHLRMTMMRGWATSIRYLEIEKMGPTNVIFSNGELFDGWFGPSMARKQRNPLLEAFDNLNQAIKEKSETIWNERNVSAK